jgi:hypothetical protein
MTIDPVAYSFHRTSTRTNCNNGLLVLLPELGIARHHSFLNSDYRLLNTFWLSSGMMNINLAIPARSHQGHFVAAANN